MKIGDIVVCPIAASPRWEQTQFQGLIVSSKLAKLDWEKVRVYNVLLADGSLCEVREDVPGLELVA